MRVLVVDGKCMETKEAMYQHLIRVFSLPTYFGNNLDALWDVLTANSELTKIEFINADAARGYLGHYGEQLISLFKKLEKENRNYYIYIIGE